MRAGRARGWPARLVAAALVAAGAGTVGLACPSRNLDIAIDGSGLLTVIEACEAIGHVCDGKVKATCDPIFCQWDPQGPLLPGVCRIKDPCTISPGGAHAYAGATPTSLQLVLFSTNPLQVQAKGPCECFDYHDFTCPDAGDTGATSSVSDCWAASIQARLAASIPAGLTFSGFDDPSQAILAMAWFQPQTAALSCDGLADGGTGLCGDPANIVACAGLGAPAGAPAYDITCASCRDGVHGSIGNDNGPCPSTAATAESAGACFLQSCAAALFPGTMP